MNSQGLIVVLTGVSAALHQPYFDNLVKEAKTTKAEFEGTRTRAKAIIDTLKRTPANKIETLVAKYDAPLTEHLGKFNHEKGANSLAAFRHAQVMLGFITSILAKSAIREV